MWYFCFRIYLMEEVTHSDREVSGQVSPFHLVGSGDQIWSHQPWQQASLPTKPSQWPQCAIFLNGGTQTWDNVTLFEGYYALKRVGDSHQGPSRSHSHVCHLQQRLGSYLLH